MTLDRLIAVADGDHLDVLVGERQLDDPLDRDAVVGKQNSLRHVDVIGRCSRTRPQLRRGPALALMKSMMSCIGVPAGTCL